MGLITPNFEELATITPGEYKVRITGSEVKTSKAGNPYVEWEDTIFDAEDPKLNDRTLKDRTPTTGKGAFRLRDRCKAATGEVPTAAFDTEVLHGRELIVVVVKGKDQNGQETDWPEVKAYKPLA